MEVEGIIEAISYRNKGIKVNGKWFNAPEEILKQVQKNQKVKLILDDFGNVLDVEILGYEEKPEKDLRIEALRASIEIVKLMFQYGQFYEFQPASESKTMEEQVSNITKLVERVYKKILDMIR